MHPFFSDLRWILSHLLTRPLQVRHVFVYLCSTLALGTAAFLIETAWPKSPKNADASWWAFQPVREPVPPVVKKTDWPRSPLDPFILAMLEAKGLSPAPPADKRTLVRLAHFDLLGLPPPPELVESFVNDTAPDAYERLRAADRSAAGRAAVRRALGPTLARCGPLCRQRRLRDGHVLPQRLALPRLCRAVLQRR